MHHTAVWIAELSILQQPDHHPYLPSKAAALNVFIFAIHHHMYVLYMCLDACRITGWAEILGGLTQGSSILM